LSKKADRRVVFSGPVIKGRIGTVNIFGNLLITAISALALALALALAGPAASQVSDVSGAIAGPAQGPDRSAAQRRWLGAGWLFSNDFIGDNKDRWHTGGLSLSGVWGPSWAGTAPSAPGQILELRLSGRVIAPDDLQIVNTDDRPYAGVLRLGLHTHAATRGFDYALGADLVVIGPQTQLDEFQSSLHDLFGRQKTNPAILDAQIGNTIRPTLVAEIGRSHDLGGRWTVRPFAEARAGDETLVRVGADLVFGNFGQGTLLARDAITGHRYQIIPNPVSGLSLLLGADIAYVEDSVYLPEDRGYSLTSYRERVRLGVNWQGRKLSVFYGLTYLGREFAAQPEGQVIGSLQARVRF
jgi:hypothetical protein